LHRFRHTFPLHSLKKQNLLYHNHLIVAVFPHGIVTNKKKKTAEKSAAFACAFIAIIVVGLSQVRILVTLIQRFPAIFSEILTVVIFAQVVHLPLRIA